MRYLMFVCAIVCACGGDYPQPDPGDSQVRQSEDWCYVVTGTERQCWEECDDSLCWQTCRDVPVCETCVGLDKGGCTLDGEWHKCAQGCE